MRKKCFCRYVINVIILILTCSIVLFAGCEGKDNSSDTTTVSEISSVIDPIKESSFEGSSILNQSTYIESTMENTYIEESTAEVSIDDGSSTYIEDSTTEVGIEDSSSTDTEAPTTEVIVDSSSDTLDDDSSEESSEIKNSPVLPEFVADISMCSDKTKSYVLPDGYLYSYEQVPIYGQTNQLVVSTDENGKIYNGSGYLDNARIRSSLEITDFNYSMVTGFIPIKVGDVLYFSKDCFKIDYKYADMMNIVFYDDAKEIISSASMYHAVYALLQSIEETKTGYISAIKISNEEILGNVAYIRLTLIGSGDELMISKNEPLLPIDYEDKWQKREKYIASDWFGEILKTVASVNSIDVSVGANVTRFLLSSDMHVNPYDINTYVENIGKVSAEVMRACNIPFYVDAGDSSTQSSGYMPSDFEANVKNVLSKLSPIPKEKLLMALGNHDGATGIVQDDHGNKLHYRIQLTNEGRSKVFFDWQRQTNPNKKFDSDGTYYYLDDPTTKTRYIIMNPFWNKWEGENYGYEYGYVTDIEHSFFHKPLFGQQQLLWFANEALNMPQGYAAVVVAHHVHETKDFEIFKGIVDAYSNHTSYEGSYIGAGVWQSSSVCVDYNNVNGEILAVFQGHNHKDVQYDYFENIPCINITTAGAYWDVKDEDAEHRVKDTATEFAVDVVTIDRTARKIYLTRLGVGDDRVISY